jgi:SAM-dependent methyltransferase
MATDVGDDASVDGGLMPASARSSCPSCGETCFRVYAEDCHDLICKCEGHWSLRECSHCGLIYTHPPIEPSALLRYYPPDYSPYNPCGGLRRSSVGRLLRQAAMWPYSVRFGSPDWSEAPFGNGRLLDVGCGTGIFLRDAAQRGWRCWGIDVSPVALDQAAKTVPAAMLEMATLDSFRNREEFQVINMSHVLEHLHEPRRALQTCFDLLAAGGKLLVTVPNIGSWEARVFGRFWRPLDVPRHLVHFRGAVLGRLLRDVGFARVSVRPSMLPSSFSESLIVCLPAALGDRLSRPKVARLLYLAMVFPAALSYFSGNAGAIELTAFKS